MPTTGRVPVGNLPSELTSFVGRQREIGEVKGLLSESRLVTLTGVGGAGKTRLALRVAADLQWAFTDGTWFVDLTQLHDQGQLTLEVQNPDVLAYLVGATLGLRDLGGGPLERVVEQLAGRQMLLVLDNCEHLIPSSAVLAHALLVDCPELRILATSRYPLVIGGETVYPVPPLPAPEFGKGASLVEMRRSEAVALFLARAQAAVPAFQLTAENHVVVAELCHRLDGLPLAIELAAARIRVLAPEQILERLTDRFALLSRGNRAASERQQTLRGCVDWSFDLCTKQEGRLWARLSVFAGGFELDAVEGVCADDEDLPVGELFDLVAALVDKSILIRDDVQDSQGEVMRYRMLETIRDYGQDKLVAAEEQATLLRRHRDWCQQLVEQARAEGISDRQAYWMARLGREHSNLRAALEFCLTESGQADAALHLAVSVPAFYWRARGLMGEGRHWLDRALAQATAPTAERAQALLINSYLAFAQGDAAAAMRLLDEGEELAERLGGTAELAHAAYIRGLGALIANDLPVAVETLGRAWTSLSGAPDLDLDLYLNVLTSFGIAAGLAGDLERAGAACREALAVFESRGESLHRSYALWLDGLITWLRGDLRKAAAQVVEALRLKRASGADDRFGNALCLEVLAWITADQERHRRAATLLGAAAVLWTEIGSSNASFLFMVGHHTTCELQIRDAVGDDAYAEAYHDGEVLRYEDALSYALDEPRQPMPTQHEDTSTPLTAANSTPTTPSCKG